MGTIFGSFHAVQGKEKMFCRQMLCYLGLKVLGVRVTKVRSSSTSDRHQFSPRPKNIPLPQVCQHMQL